MPLNILISDYVKNDPTAFCTYKEYKNSITAFITLGNLREKVSRDRLMVTFLDQLGSSKVSILISLL